MPVDHADLQQVSGAVWADVHDKSITYLVGVHCERPGVQGVVVRNAVPCSAFEDYRFVTVRQYKLPCCSGDVKVTLPVWVLFERCHPAPTASLGTWHDPFWLASNATGTDRLDAEP